MKRITTMMAIMLFTVMISAGVQAATLRCTVEKVEENVVTMICGEKAVTLSVGTKVKVKTTKAKAAVIEGC